MPVQKRCKNSGAIIFELTEDEKAIKNVAKDVDRLKKENAKLSKRIKELENTVKRGDIVVSNTKD